VCSYRQHPRCTFFEKCVGGAILFTNLFTIITKIIAIFEVRLAVKAEDSRQNKEVIGLNKSNKSNKSK
jgi:hypothetical protein